MNLRTGEDTLLHKGEGTTSMLAAVSPDENSHVVIKIYSNTYQTAHLYRNGKEQAVLPASERQSQVPYVLLPTMTVCW